MANLMDYLDWRGDLTLAVSPFNEVDALILAELSFVDFDGIVPPPEIGAVFRCVRRRRHSLPATADVMSTWAFWCRTGSRKCCES